MSPRFQRQREAFFLEAAGYAVDTGESAIRLYAIPTPSSFGLNNAGRNVETIIKIALEWQALGKGTLYGADEGWPVFSFNATAIEEYNRRIKSQRRSEKLQHLLNINWTAVSAIAALIAAIAASVSAYFSFMLMKSS